MMETGLAFLIFWGVWVIIPIAVDGLETISRLITVFFSRRRKLKKDISFEDLSLVSVVIPAHNEAKIIDRCLNSVKIQDYPHERLEVIIVDDGSIDGTREKVKDHINGNGKNGLNSTNCNGVRVNGNFIPVGDFSGVVRLFCLSHTGKAEALNTGIIHSHGDIIVNIDCDVVLPSYSLRKMVEAFMADSQLGAATGNIEISSEILEERDKSGHLILDEEGKPIPKKLNWMEKFLANCQFLEYLSAFQLGREAQAATNTLYTLSGAYSAFRRDVLLKSSLYRARSVSEDTDITFDLRRQPVKIGFVREAKAYLEPVIDLDELYSQRVRWSRGQLEVCTLYRDICGKSEFGWMGFFGLPKMLLVDHTLAFPRLVWTLMLPFFVFLGYSSQVIVTAVALMYSFYVFLEFINSLAAWSVSDRETRAETEKKLPYCFLLPLYRFLVFHFRMSGYLAVLKDPPAWSIPGPVNGLKNGVKNLKHRLGNGLGVFLANLKLGLESGTIFRKTWVAALSKFYQGLPFAGKKLLKELSFLFLVTFAMLVLWQEGEIRIPKFSFKFFHLTFSKLKKRLRLF